MQITPLLYIPDDELRFSFISASGPGGQNINKTATAVQLRFDVNNSSSLPADMKARLAKLAGNRMNQAGVIVIEAKRYRTQEQNHTDAENRLKVLLQKAAHRPKPRRATRPSLAARMKRLDSKKRHAAVKKGRSSFDDGDFKNPG
jgi:ribosome-associated protein